MLQLFAINVELIWTSDKKGIKHHVIEFLGKNASYNLYDES